MFMPGFHQYPKEAAIISRLLGGYGELEYLVAICLGRALGNLKIGVRVIYRATGETQRIRLADALMKEGFEKVGLTAEYADCLGAIRKCVAIRNKFSHCHWAHLPMGLFFTEVRTAALAGEELRFDWKEATLNLLTEYEAYFEYCHKYLWHLQTEYLKRSDPVMHRTSHPKPPKQPP